MTSKPWKFLKETGIFGSLAAAAIIWVLGLLLVFLSTLNVFAYNLTLTIPVFMIAGFGVALSGLLYLIFQFTCNPTRQYINVFGYFRKLYHAEYYPYLTKDGKYYTRIKKTIEYRIARDGVAIISPFTFYAYKPRGTGGEEILRNVLVTTLLNNQPNALVAEQTMVGTDGCSVTIRATKPLQAGDLINFCVEYEQYGLNALCQEELDEYKKRPNLANNLRNRLIRERNVEYIYASPSYSRKYVVAVNFPANYPMHLLDTVEDMAIITLSSKPIDKHTMNKIANLTVDNRRIQLEYEHEFRSAHGHLLLWRLPTKSELLSYAQS
jgi:hypothetical protein